MPAAVAGWIISATGATGLAAAGIQAAVALTFSLAVAKVTAPKGPKPSDLQNEIRQSDAPRVRYVGTNRASGAVMYYDWHKSKYAGGFKGFRVLYKLIAVGQGGIGTVHKWYLNEKEVVVTGEQVTETLGPERSPWYDARVYLRTRSGRGAEIDGGAYPSLIASSDGVWTEAHRLTGVGTILGEFKRLTGADITETYPGGDPAVSIVFDGDDLRHPDGRTPAHSTNLVWQLYDILVHPDYGWFSTDEMEPSSWEGEIDHAGDLVPTKAGPNRLRFAGGGGYQLAEPLKDVAQRWLDGFGGRLYLTPEGRIGVRSARWTPPTYTITRDKIVSWEGGVGREGIDIVTTLVPKYPAPETNYQDTTADAWTDPLAAQRYGEAESKEIDLPVVRHHAQARFLAKVKAAELNPHWRLTMRLRFWGLLLLDENGVWVDLPHIGIINQPFRIRHFGFDLDAGDGVVTVELEHWRQPAYEWDSETEDGEPPSLPDAEPDPDVPEPVVVISAEVITGSGDPWVRITYQVQDGETVLAQFRPSGTTDPWTDMLDEGTGGSVRTPGLFDGQPVDARLGIAKTQYSHEIVGDWTYVLGIDVIANPTGPDAPVVVSHSGAAGGPFEIVFAPDLGINYRSTKLYRAGPTDNFSAATVVDESFAMVPEVTLTGTVPGAGARYWLQSENRSGVKSDPVLVGSYIIHLDDGMTPSLTVAPAAAWNPGTTDRGGDVAIMMRDVTMPSSSSASGILIEAGAAGNGIGIGLTGTGVLRAQVGNNAADGRSRIDVPVAGLLGQVIEIAAQVDMPTLTLKLWINGELMGTSTLSGTPPAAWANNNGGAFGLQGGTSAVGGLSGAWPGTLTTDARIFYGQLFAA